MPKPIVGKKVPAFEGDATGEQTISSKDLIGQPFVLYFNPRDNTPGCTVESNDFSAQHAKFKRRKIRILGISRDTLKSHEKFKAKFDFPFELIADPDEKICNLFEVMKDKNMYGKKVRGIERSTFLFDKDGILRREWRKVKIEGHVDEVLEAAKAL
jgi:peroxiredoxin Q/BCP